jgi:hypothetical protein
MNPEALQNALTILEQGMKIQINIFIGLGIFGIALISWRQPLTMSIRKERECNSLRHLN